MSALKGLESNRPDSSKFRFWVKSKGENYKINVFHLIRGNDLRVNFDDCEKFILIETLWKFMSLR